MSMYGIKTLIAQHEYDDGSVDEIEVSRWDRDEGGPAIWLKSGNETIAIYSESQGQALIEAIRAMADDFGWATLVLPDAD